MRLSGRAAEIYAHLSNLVIPGLCSAEDEIGLATLARLIEKFEMDDYGGSDLAAMTRMMDKFAMTPSARAQAGVHGWLNRERVKAGATNTMEKFA